MQAPVRRDRSRKADSWSEKVEIRPLTVRGACERGVVRRLGVQITEERLAAHRRRLTVVHSFKGVGVHLVHRDFLSKLLIEGIGDEAVRRVVAVCRPRVLLEHGHAILALVPAERGQSLSVAPLDALGPPGTVLVGQLLLDQAALVGEQRLLIAGIARLGGGDRRQGPVVQQVVGDGEELGVRAGGVDEVDRDRQLLALLALVVDQEILDDLVAEVVDAHLGGRLLLHLSGRSRALEAASGHRALTRAGHLLDGVGGRGGEAALDAVCYQGLAEHSRGRGDLSCCLGRRILRAHLGRGLGCLFGDRYRHPQHVLGAGAHPGEERGGGVEVGVGVVERVFRHDLAPVVGVGQVERVHADEQRVERGRRQDAGTRGRPLQVLPRGPRSLGEGREVGRGARVEGPGSQQLGATLGGDEGTDLGELGEAVQGQARGERAVRGGGELRDRGEEGGGVDAAVGVEDAVNGGGGGRR